MGAIDFITAKLPEVFIAVGSYLAGIMTHSIKAKMSSTRDHDIKFYDEINNFISSELMVQFFNSLGYNKFYKNEVEAIDDYLRLKKHPEKYYFNKEIQKHKIKLDDILNKLRDYMGAHFFKHNDPRYDHYELHPEFKKTYVAVHSEIYRKAEEELDALVKEAQKTYQEYIKTAKNKLRI